MLVRVLCVTWVCLTRCMCVCVCLFRLLEFNKADGPIYSIIFIAKERANLFLSFVNNTHQYVQHISILLTIFPLLSCMVLCLLLPLVTASDENIMHLSPFHSHQMNLREKKHTHTHTHRVWRPESSHIKYTWLRRQSYFCVCIRKYSSLGLLYLAAQQVSHFSR